MPQPPPIYLQKLTMPLCEPYRKQVDIGRGSYWRHEALVLFTGMLHIDCILEEAALEKLR